MLRLKDLKTFVTVCECGGFGKAADILDTAQSHVSTRMRLLEKDFGAPVFDRLHRGIRPNRNGEILYRHAKRVMDEVDALESAIKRRGAE